MRIIKEQTNIDFMRRRGIGLAASAVIILVGTILTAKW